MAQRPAAAAAAAASHQALSRCWTEKRALPPVCMRLVSPILGRRARGLSSLQRMCSGGEPTKSLPREQGAGVARPGSYRLNHAVDIGRHDCSELDRIVRLETLGRRKPPARECRRSHRDRIHSPATGDRNHRLADARVARRRRFRTRALTTFAIARAPAANSPDDRTRFLCLIWVASCSSPQGRIRRTGQGWPRPKLRALAESSKAASTRGVTTPSRRSLPLQAVRREVARNERTTDRRINSNVLSV
jgi:hypothetical protein